MSRHTLPTTTTASRPRHRLTGGDDQLVVTVSETYSARRLTSGRLLAMAACTPADSTDPVDEAIVASLATNRPDIVRIPVAADNFHPATPERRYSLAKVTGFLIDKKPQDLMVMRGTIDAVLAHATIDREEKTPFLKTAEFLERTGLRCLAVASAEILPDGTPGEFHVEGFIALALEKLSDARKEVAGNPNAWVRVNLWSATLRVQHWANLVLIVALSITGYVIMDPGILPQPMIDPAGPTPYLMGTMRFIHFVSGFGWIVLALTRLWLAFVARDRQLRWRSLWPLKSKKDVQGLIGTIRYYLFIDAHGPVYLAHNPLQQLAYTAIYGLCIIQIFSGLAIYGLYNHYNGFWRILSAPAGWIGIPNMRLIHALIMFLIWVFIIIHIYLAVRADSVERHGGISSMINGGVWLRRGTKPLDAPKVG
ncbi:Ni/Fe-hydrogenase, b-type cytochrome subunit [Corynebacterium choanae]|uniref:Putative Ni/Fe-hydrogenase B-type cytochrome subunit n=1 Tax=Corynebacterium choanae TaxID=1862358 RepID=A0A3G6J8B8_9CORY|nr:Ni/Fe-hydrogenase, b-type cytochrome subunit [Corynebacterium choanae]AZA14345.1 putative Ni/Fe-hydrogenase B-type cytochrome subunit [Corynebacterium choanae]